MGAGPGLGDPQMIPTGHTDLVLATIGEEFGWLGIFVVLVTLGLVIVRSLRIATRAPGDYTFFLVLGLTITLAAQALLIACGLLGLLPLSGVVTPFLSFGRSSMLANCLAIGVVLAVAERARGPSCSFARPVRWVKVVLVLAGFAVLSRAAWVQVVRADETLTAASLTLQGDGARRYTYNPRLLAAARRSSAAPFSIATACRLRRAGAAELTRHKETFAHLGINLDEACPPRDGRCYPFGGSLFHVIGDWNTQRNWAASNTSFVERDADRDLRGYDDGAKVIEITNARTAATQATIRRDYRALVPLVRHRYEPDHPAVVALRQGVHDVKTTIDVRLQLRAAWTLERHIRDNKYSRGAIVVLDPASGDVLASVSYPWPSKDPAAASVEEDAKAHPLSIARATGCIRLDDIQAGDRDGSAASGSVARADGVHVPSSARFARGDPASRLDASDSRRRTGQVAARLRGDDPRHRRILQRLFRAARRARRTTGARGDIGHVPHRRRGTGDGGELRKALRSRPTARAKCWRRRCGWRWWRERSRQAASSRSRLVTTGSRTEDGGSRAEAGEARTRNRRRSRMPPKPGCARWTGGWRRRSQERCVRW